MTKLTQYLIDLGMLLPPDEREKLAILLLESLPYDDTASESEESTLARRIDEVETGHVELLDANEALDRLETKYRVKFGR